jgi:hypothetical protein
MANVSAAPRRYIASSCRPHSIPDNATLNRQQMLTPRETIMLTKLTLIYTVASATYDEENDTLVAEVRLTTDAFNYTFPIDEAVERYKITAEFSMRRYTVDDISTEVGDALFAYPAQVMMLFLNELELRYSKLPHDSSPIDVFAETVTFVNEQLTNIP